MDDVFFFKADQSADHLNSEKSGFRLGKDFPFFRDIAERLAKKDDTPKEQSSMMM